MSLETLVKVKKILSTRKYVPHVNQQQLHNDTHRYKVVRCGRRFGKTIFAINELITKACFDTGNYWFIAPTYNQAKMIAWRVLLDYCPKDLIAKKNETELSIDLINGSRIELKGTEDPDKLRGVGLKGIVYDEFAFSKAYAWEVIEPVLTESKGWAIFISTPNGRNHFYDLFMKEYEDPQDYKSFHFTSYDNPYLDKEEIDKKKLTMSADMFGQEYMAEFTYRQGAVWKDFGPIHIVTRRNPAVNTTIYGSIDFGFATGHKTAVLWHEIDHDNNIFTFDGFGVEGKTIDEIDELMKVQTKGLTIQGIFPDPARPDLIEELYRKSWPMLDTRKDVELGVAKVAEVMKINPITNKPKWTISGHLTEALKQIEMYAWKEVRSDRGTFKQTPDKKNDDFCFGAGTKILTDKGQINIEKLDKSYKVWTPFGWSKIKSTGLTGEKEVVDFRGTVATPDHKVLTRRGFVAIDTLRYFDTIYICNKPYILKEYHIGDTQTRPIRRIGDIFVHLRTRSSEARLNSSIGQSGSRLTERFRKTTSSTISMATLLTTILKTSLVSHAKNMLERSTTTMFQRPLSSILKRLEKQLDSGMVLQKGLNGTERMGEIVGKTEPFTPEVVTTVETNTKLLSHPGQDFADRIVRQVLLDAGVDSNKLNPPKTLRKVYNLSTEHGCYFADGILVSNCDALRYFIFNYLHEPDEPLTEVGTVTGIGGIEIPKYNIGG